MRHKGLTNFRTHFKGLRANRRAEPGENVIRAVSKTGNGLFQHAGTQSTPARMGGSHFGACTVAEKYRQAVGGHNGADCTRSIAVRGIGAFRGIGFAGKTENSRTMNLLKPDRFRRQLPCCKQPLTILFHMIEMIATVRAQV
ncbi:hypothetical protein D3C76_1451310 [compost metagenome]